MLTRRVFRELTDGVLFSLPIRPLCLSARLRPQRPPTVHPSPQSPSVVHLRPSSTSTRWKARQGRDRFVREAKVAGLKSRAAFKLLEIDQKHKLFRKSQTVVDLGYAPGSWSQVAFTKTQPNGRVIGIDILPVQPPKGVSTIQGDFLAPAVQEEVRSYVRDTERGRLKRRSVVAQDEEEELLDEEEFEETERGYVDAERHARLDSHESPALGGDAGEGKKKKKGIKERDMEKGRVVDVVLSDMSAPWDQTTGLWVRSVSNPYSRMMNTSGNRFRDHAGSMVCFAFSASFFLSYPLLREAAGRLVTLANAEMGDAGSV
jgi:21S rRNA (uridine2791-2'-O)-methyltransferase